MKLLNGYINSIEFFAIFIIGFAFFIACFDVAMAVGYFIFIIASSFYILKRRKIKNENTTD